MIAELSSISLASLLLFGPPIASGPAEGPDPAPSLDADAEAEGEAAAIADEAAIAAQDRAVLERNNEEVHEWVRHLDALAGVEDRLDGCGRAVQAELRMDLALAYLRLAGTCADPEASETAAEADEGPPTDLEFPRECGAASDPSACAEQLLQAAAAFGDTGPAGAEDPLAQAVGCPHAAESMTVERLYGTCVAEQYDGAVDRWRANQSSAVVEPDLRSGRPLDVPRWGSILGIGLGVGAIAGGAALVAIDGRCPGGGDPMLDVDQCPNIYNTDAGGAVLLSVGALAVISMGAILTITEVRAKRSGRPGSDTVMRRRMQGIQRVTAVTGWQAPSLQLRRPRQ